MDAQKQKQLDKLDKLRKEIEALGKEILGNQRYRKREFMERLDDALVDLYYAIDGDKHE